MLLQWKSDPMTQIKNRLIAFQTCQMSIHPRSERSLSGIKFHSKISRRQKNKSVGLRKLEICSLSKILMINFQVMKSSIFVAVITLLQFETFYKNTWDLQKNKSRLSGFSKHLEKKLKIVLKMRMKKLELLYLDQKFLDPYHKNSIHSFLHLRMTQIEGLFLKYNVISLYNSRLKIQKLQMKMNRVIRDQSDATALRLMQYQK